MSAYAGWIAVIVIAVAGAVTLALGWRKSGHTTVRDAKARRDAEQRAAEAELREVDRKAVEDIKTAFGRLLEEIDDDDDGDLADYLNSRTGKGSGNSGLAD